MMHAPLHFDRGARRRLLEPRDTYSPSGAAAIRRPGTNLMLPKMGERRPSSMWGSPKDPLETVPDYLTEARQHRDEVVKHFSKSVPKAVTCLWNGFDDAMAVMALPKYRPPPAKVQKLWDLTLL